MILIRSPKNRDSLNLHGPGAAAAWKPRATFWVKAREGKLFEVAWKKFIKVTCLSAVVDYPMSLYWKDLMKMFPNAKVLLTVRDPIKWYLSVKNTIRHI
jgi:hypothetical protein